MADALGELVIDMMSPTLSGVIALLWPACAGRILPRKACLYNRSKKWRMGCPLARRIAKLAGTTLMQGIKIADAIIAQDDRFTVDRKLAGAFLQGGLSDPRIALRPVITAARDQPHAVAATLDADAKAIAVAPTIRLHAT